MEFDSPDAAKEFPGLYMAESGKVDDSSEYVDEGDKKKSKKDKKKDKDKGYSALAPESDEEDPLDPKSPGKGMKIKAFSKLSGKKKEKDKKLDKEKEHKKAEKEAKEKRKSEEKERKSLEKELTATPGPSSTPSRPQIPFSGAHLSKANSLNHSTVLTPQSSIDRGTPVKKSLISSLNEVPVKDATPAKPPKEKSTAFNVFLNAPAPLLSKLKDKDGSKDKHGKSKEQKEKKRKEKDKDKGDSKVKKEPKEQKDKEKDKKEHVMAAASGMAKVKLKLMRSKNSLEDPNDVPHVVSSHQFPEDPEALAKEIKKYEGLLEQAHLQLKSTKKINKKQEELLWELQIRLTQLKRKLRSINALSSASSFHVHAHSSTSDRVQAERSVSPKPKPHPIFKKCDSIDGHARAKLSTNTTSNVGQALPDKSNPISVPVSTTAAINVSSSTKENDNIVPLAATVPIVSSAPQEIPKIPLPPSKNSYKSEIVAAATSPSKLTLSASPPQVPLAETVQAISPCAEALKSSRNSIVVLSSPTQINLGTTVTVAASVPEADCIIASPRPSIDTVAQVHRLSSSGDKSDTEDMPNESEILDEDDDEYLNRRSISNLSIGSSQVESKENIEAVLDDANKMIGSMHEELMFEGTLDLVNGDDHRLCRSGDHLNSSSTRMLGQDDSDVELFTNDLELELPNEEPCPDPFSMPVFDTAEYMSIENEALSMFNEQLTSELKLERNELEILLQSRPIKPPLSDSESTNSQNENDYNDLIKVWTQIKSENEVLWDNVNRLRQAVSACKVDEFRLQTRLKYIESKASALSPVTTTTPLQTEG